MWLKKLHGLNARTNFVPPSVGPALLPVYSASVTPVLTSLVFSSSYLTLLGSICLCFLDVLSVRVLSTSIGLFLFYGTLVRSCAWPSFVFHCRVITLMSKRWRLGQWLAPLYHNRAWRTPNPSLCYLFFVSPSVIDKLMDKTMRLRKARVSNIHNETKYLCFEARQGRLVIKKQILVRQ